MTATGLEVRVHEGRERAEAARVARTLTGVVGLTDAEVSCAGAVRGWFTALAPHPQAPDLRWLLDTADMDRIGQP